MNEGRVTFSYGTEPSFYMEPSTGIKETMEINFRLITKPGLGPTHLPPFSFTLSRVRTQLCNWVENCYDPFL